MPSTTQRLAERGLIRPPKFLPDNVHYETVMGSVAYGVSHDSSDFDVYGFCIPPKDVIFPHLAGVIPGFGTQPPKFEQFQQHHVVDQEAGREYDLAIYNIVKFFQLCMENNPNMIDSLFTPVNCVLHQTKVGGMVRDARRIFLHKGAWHKFRGYAYSQLHKMAGKNPQPGSKRDALRHEFGFDVKFAYHVVRLLGEVEQILEEGDLDLQRNSEQLKAVRRGEMTEADIREWASRKEAHLDTLYHKCALPHRPDEEAIRGLLLACLEEHYGSLSECVIEPDAATRALQEIQAVLDHNARLLGR